MRKIAIHKFFDFYIKKRDLTNLFDSFHSAAGRGGGPLGISGWGYAAGTPEPLTYTRAISAEFFLPYTRVNSLNPPHPRIAVFQKLLRSLARSNENKTLYHNP